MTNIHQSNPQPQIFARSTLRFLPSCTSQLCSCAGSWIRLTPKFSKIPWLHHSTAVTSIRHTSWCESPACEDIAQPPRVADPAESRCKVSWSRRSRGEHGRELCEQSTNDPAASRCLDHWMILNDHHSFHGFMVHVTAWDCTNHPHFLHHSVASQNIDTWNPTKTI